MDRQPSRLLIVRLGWFVGLWVAGVLAVGFVAYGLKLWL
jgi:hypothetical protein